MEKKHLVILLGGYKPMLSPGGLIIQRVIDAWRDKYYISVIASWNCAWLKKDEVIDGVHVYRVKDYNRLLHNTITDKLAKTDSRAKKVLLKAALLLKQCIFYCYRCLRYESITVPYEKRLIKQIRSIAAIKKIDCVISVTEPHENSAAAYIYKKKYDRDVSWLIYQLDRFSNANSLYENKISRPLKKKRHYRREKAYLETCERLFILKPIAEHYSQDCFEPYREKIVATDHPLVVKPQIAITGSDNDVIRLTYGGSLDRTLRNPTIALEMVQKAAREADIHFDLYTFGNCEAILRKFINGTDGAIMNHSRVMREELVEIIARSDILVSIGNKSDNEVPSKFFDYISYGLPIIHFYFSDRDVILKYLESYPLSICIKMDAESIDENAHRLAEFCHNAKGKIFNFDIVSAAFAECTPEYVANQIGEAI